MNTGTHNDRFEYLNAMKTIYEAISSDPKTFDSKKSIKALREAIKTLPSDQQEVLDLHFNQNLSVKTIAEQSNRSMTPVYKRLNIAIYKLKKQFNPKAFVSSNDILSGNN